MIYQLKRRRTVAGDHRPDGDRETPRRRGGIDAMMVLDRVRHDPVDLDLLTAALCVDLVEQPMAEEICLTLDPIGTPHRADGLDWTLCVNARHDARRQRFSIAHAIGHLVLHADRIGAGLCDDTSYACPADGPRPNTAIGREAESAANRIAVGILLPRDAVIRRSREFADLTGLAGHFRVGTKAMRIRLEALDLPVPPMRALVSADR